METDRPATNGEPLAPVRTITRPPGHHWFGYYDKEQFDPSDRFVLGMRVDFEHRTPEPEDTIQIGMVDLEEKDRWIPLGGSRAWNWQQGCMLQWLPGSASKVLWNDREKDRFICRILDVFTGEQQVVPHPVYSVSPDGKTAVAPDFARIADVRPGYGYAGLPDRHGDDLAPEQSGIFRVDLENGDVDLILSVAAVAEMGEIPQAASGIKHYFNHLLFSPDGARFIALHRWRYPEGNRLTRLLTAAPDGSDVRLVIPNGYASHFIWRDPRHILSQSRHWLGNEEWGNFLFEDRESAVLEEIGRGVLDPNGHFIYMPGGEWLVCDTYPTGPERFQTPHLYHPASDKRIDLGHFPSPPVYTGEWRVDTHPRLSRDAKRLCIDSAHGGEGRQMHLIDIEGMTG
ncbi:MAG: hypothetical protein WD342_12905 [Verrucomicrobiales bacterium]